MDITLELLQELRETYPSDYKNRGYYSLISAIIGVHIGLRRESVLQDVKRALEN